MHLFTEFSSRLINYIKDIDFEKNIEKKYLDCIVVERPRNIMHGHLSTNAAMILSRPLGLDRSYYYSRADYCTYKDGP